MTLDWQSVQSAFYGQGNNSFTLTNSHVKLLLFLIDEYSYSKALWNSPDDAEWDDIEAFIAELEDRLMSTKPVFSVVKANHQDIDDSTWTKIVWGVKEIDLGDNFDISNDKFVVPETGRYFFHVSLAIDDLGAADAWLYLSLNTLQPMLEAIISNSLDEAHISGSIVMDLESGDEIDAYLIHFAGSTRTVVARGATKFFGFQL